MKNAPSESFGSFLLKGIIVGLVATQALDLISTLTYENEDQETRDEENRVRGGRQAYEVAVAKLANGFGRTLTREEEKAWGWRFHKTFGIIGGLQYLALRNKYPKISAGFGLAFGASFFLIADEILIYAFKLVPGPQKFSFKVHARGAVAHTAYGVAAEAAIRVIEAFPQVLIKEDQYLFPKKSLAQSPINFATR
jgi:hypothetical protein